MTLTVKPPKVLLGEGPPKRGGTQSTRLVDGQAMVYLIRRAGAIIGYRPLQVGRLLAGGHVIGIKAVVVPVVGHWLGPIELRQHRH